MFKKQYLKTKKQIWNYKIGRYRSSRSEVFCKKGVFKNVTKFTRKHLYQRFFFNKVAGFQPATLFKETPVQMFFCEFCDYFKSTFFVEHLWMATSVDKQKWNQNFQTKTSKRSILFHPSNFLKTVFTTDCLRVLFSLK